MANIVIIGNADDEMVELDGFSNTPLTTVATNVSGSNGVSWDADGNPYYCDGVTDVMRRNVGFTTTLDVSVDVSGFETAPLGISWTGTDTWMSGNSSDTNYLFTGFTNTIDTSYSTIAAVADNSPWGITWDGTDHYFVGKQGDNAYQMDGDTSTELARIDLSAVGTDSSGCTWEDPDFIWCDSGTDDMHKMVGFTTTVDTTVDISGIDTTVSGITVADFNARVGIIAGLLLLERHAPRGVARGVMRGVV